MAVGNVKDFQPSGWSMKIFRQPSDFMLKSVFRKISTPHPWHSQRAHLWELQRKYPSFEQAPLNKREKVKPSIPISMKSLLKYRPKIKIAAVFCLVNFNFFLIGAAYFNDSSLWTMAYTLWILGTVFGSFCQITRRDWYKQQERIARRNAKRLQAAAQNTSIS